MRIQHRIAPNKCPAYLKKCAGMGRTSGCQGHWLQTWVVVALTGTWAFIRSNTESDFLCAVDLLDQRQSRTIHFVLTFFSCSYNCPVCLLSPSVLSDSGSWSAFVISACQLSIFWKETPEFLPKIYTLIVGIATLLFIISKMQLQKEQVKRCSLSIYGI